MKVFETQLEGCSLLSPKSFKDSRGTFVKNYSFEIFQHFGLETNFKEDFFSLSYKNVIRGMHFQGPPHEHVKIVNCLKGEILDVVIDLRKQSKSYMHVDSFILSDTNNLCLYIPKGLAHGFKVLTEEALVYYKVTSAYSQDHDRGILWSSIPFDWKIENPIISERDQLFPQLEHYLSPF